MKFRKVDIEQEGEEWHSFRALGLGGTDAGILLGLNPYEDISSIFNAKTSDNYSKEFSESGIAAMEHGKSLEDTARTTFSQLIGINFKPTCAIHNEYDFIRSSLDGISDDFTTLLEIKCPYREASFNKHVNGILPYYYAQAQHQLLTTSSDLLYFGSYFKSANALELIIYKVFPDAGVQKELTKRCINMWKSITSKKPPSSLTYYQYNLVNQKAEVFLRKKVL